MREPAGRADRARGVTTLLNYAVLLVVVAIVVSGLFLGIGTFVENQQERAIGSQMETVGNRLASDLTTADRLVRTANTTADGATTVRLRSRLPETVAGSQYLISISGSGPRYTITLRSVDPEVVTFVVVRSTVGISVPDGQVTGGRLEITYVDSDAPDDDPEPSDPTDLEVSSADA